MVFNIFSSQFFKVYDSENQAFLDLFVNLKVRVEIETKIVVIFDQLLKFEKNPNELKTQNQFCVNLITFSIFSLRLKIFILFFSRNSIECHNSLQVHEQLKFTAFV